MAPPHFLHSFPSSVLSTVIVQSPRLLISLFNTLTSGTSNGIVIWALISLPSLSLVALSLFSYPGKACITTICGGLHGSYQRTKNSSTLRFSVSPILPFQAPHETLRVTKAPRIRRNVWPDRSPACG